MSSTRAVGVYLLLSIATAAAGEISRVIPPGQEHRILALAAPLQLGSPIAAGYRLANIGVADSGFTFILEGDSLAPIHLRVTPDAELSSHRLELTPPASDLSAAGRAAVARLSEIIAPRIDAAFWEGVLSAPAASRAQSRAATSNTAALASILVASALILLLELRYSTASGAAVGAAFIAAAPLGVWYLTSGSPPGGAPIGQIETFLQDRERHLVQLALVAAVAAALAAAAASPRTRRCNRAAWLDAALVLGWSLFVRFALTSANVLTDGGSGWSRLLEYRRGFGSVAVLLDVLLPGASMWDAIAVPRVVAALSPPLVVLLAHAIGASRAAAALCGLALASLPVHAALYSSDFESGAVVTTLLGGLALVANGGNSERAGDVAAGLTLIAFGLYGRPEMLVVGLPLLALAPRLVHLWRHPVLAGAAAWLVALAAVRAGTLGGLGNSSVAYVGGPWSTLPFAEILTTGALLPYWLWLPLPLGVIWLRGNARAVTLAGLLAGIVPLHVTPTMSDPTATYLEFFRYGAFAMPWLALLAGAGASGLASAIGLPFLTIVAALWMLATPLLERDYLALRYGPAVDEAVFREALLQVPEGCRLIVPDDPETFFDVFKRYAEIARDVSAHHPRAPVPGRIVAMSEALRDPPRGGCWYFYRGSYCHDGFEGIAPPTCQRLLESAPFAPAWSRTVEYRSHRLVTRPRRAVAPWYEPHLELRLYQWRGPPAGQESTAAKTSGTALGRALE